MNIKKIIELRDHWYFQGQGEFYRPAHELEFETGDAFEESLVCMIHEKQLQKTLANIIGEVEKLIASGQLGRGSKIAKNLGVYKSVLTDKDKIKTPRPNFKNFRDNIC